ncbi:MAG: V-type ATP synthase subunit F, partial [Oscillospiraceae bacterium]
MGLVGVPGVVVHETAQLKEELDKICADKETGLVLITSKLVKESGSLVFDHKLKYKTPLIVEMPDRHGGDDVAAGIKKYISDVVGIKI